MHRRFIPILFKKLPLIAAALVFCLFGCGDDDEAAVLEEPDSAGRGAMLCSWLFAPGGAPSGFVRFVPDGELEGGEMIDGTARAIEIPGGMSCGFLGSSVFVHSFVGPTVTRYDLQSDGSLSEGATVSFANFGVTSLAGGFGRTDFLFTNRAFYIDFPSLQIVVWDPSRMETVGTISLADFQPPDDSTILTRVRAVQRDDDTLVLYGNYGTGENSAAGMKMALLDINASEQTLAVSEFDTRCGNLQPAVARTLNGDIYFGPGPQAPIEDALGLPQSFSPCSVRLLAGASDFEPSFNADLNALTGGRPTAGPIPIANDGRALLQAFDTESATVDPELSSGEHLNIPNWLFFEWELGSPGPATPVPELNGVATFAIREFDERWFVAQVGPDFSVDLIDLTVSPREPTYSFSSVPTNLMRIDP